MMLSLTAKDTQLGFYAMEKIVLHGNGVDTMHFATLKMNRLWEGCRILNIKSAGRVTPKRSKQANKDQNPLRFQSDEEAVNCSTTVYKGIRQLLSTGSKFKRSELPFCMQERDVLCLAYYLIWK